MLTRRYAAAALGQRDRAAVVEPLIHALADANATVRAAAAEALGRTGDPRGGRPLSELLKDPSEQVRAAATVALSSLDTPEAIPGLLAALGAEHPPETLVSLAGSLARHRHPAARAALLGLTGHRAMSVRLAAARGLAVAGGADAAEPLVGMLPAGTSDGEALLVDAIVAALAAIAERDRPRVIGALAAAVDGSERVVAGWAVVALSTLGEQEQPWRDLLIALAEPALGALGAGATRALGGYADPAATEHLVTLLSAAGAPEYGRTAADALVRQGPLARPALRLAAASGERVTRWWAAWCLVSLGEAEGHETSLMEALRAGPEPVQAAAAVALGAMRCTTAVPALIDALASDDTALLVAAIDALGQIGSNAAVPALERVEMWASAAAGLTRYQPVLDAARRAIETLARATRD